MTSYARLFQQSRVLSQINWVCLCGVVYVDIVSLYRCLCVCVCVSILQRSATKLSLTFDSSFVADVVVEMKLRNWFTLIMEPIA